MKKHFLLGIIIFIFTLLIGCANNSGSFFQQTQVKKDLLRETWLPKVNTDPNVWTKNSDYWFLTGEPNNIERYDLNAPIKSALTTMSIRVPDFTNIQVEGKFQIQIMGRQEHNSVYVVGPNDQARQTIVEMKGQTLCIHKVKDSKIPTNRVLIRIGVRDLNNLTSHGPCLIAGRDISSNGLTINSTSSAKIFLSGYMNVTNINQLGSGTITVIGAFSPSLKLNVRGNGCVNVSGRVGVRYINHAGNGTVSIVGADTDGLTIMASGAGKTTVAGYANLKKVTACDKSCVLLYWVNSNSTYAYASDRAFIGLAGNTKNLNLDITGSSRFDGQYLHANNAYVRTREASHANVTIGEKMFAAAGERSSIYFFGSPNVVSRYTSGLGTIIPVWNDAPISATGISPRFQGPAAYAAPVHRSLKDELAYEAVPAPRTTVRTYRSEPQKTIYSSQRYSTEKDGTYYRVKRTTTVTKKVTPPPSTSSNNMNFKFKKPQYNE